MTRNLGMLCLGVYLILVGLGLLGVIGIPPLILGLLALAGGILILLGR